MGGLWERERASKRERERIDERGRKRRRVGSNRGRVEKIADG